MYQRNRISTLLLAALAVTTVAEQGGGGGGNQGGSQGTGNQSNNPTGKNQFSEGNQQNQQQQSGQSGQTNALAQSAANLQQAGFAPTTLEMNKRFQEQLLGTILAFCPNDAAKTLVRDRWVEAVKTGIETEYAGLGGIRHLCSELYDGITYGNWPWTITAEQHAQTMQQQQGQQAKTAV